MDDIRMNDTFDDISFSELGKCLNDEFAAAGPSVVSSGTVNGLSGKKKSTGVTFDDSQFFLESFDYSKCDKSKNETAERSDLKVECDSEDLFSESDWSILQTVVSFPYFLFLLFVHSFSFAI